METKNNTPETPVKPTDKERLQIFMQYHGHNFDNGESGHLSYGQILAHNIYMEGSVEDGYSHIISGYPIEKCSILLKPLGRISKNELANVSEFMQTEITKMTNDSFFVKGFSGKLDDMRDYELSLTDLNWKAYHYLQEIGCAMPFGRYSIKDLSEAGIYKLIE